MTKPVKLHSIFISSPSDTIDERSGVVQVFRYANKILIKNNIVIEPINWEEDSFPQTGNPQQNINSLIPNADTCIAIFKHRFGTPTPNGYNSGTEEEIDIFLRKNKNIMLYVSKEPLPANGDNKEYLQIQSLVKNIKNKVQYYEYDNCEQFKFILYHHLMLRFINEDVSIFHRIKTVSEEKKIFIQFKPNNPIHSLGYFDQRNQNPGFTNFAYKTAN